eukprot:g16358.t1
MRTETPDIAAEQAAAKEEQARLAAEQAAAEGQLIAEEQARLSAEKEGAEEQARMAAEQAAAEKQLIAEEQARLAAEQAAAKEEQARLATEQAAAEEQAAANEEQARLAAEQAAAEEQAAANEEQARLAAEQAAANEEQARMAAEKEAARVASEQVAAEKQARVAAEQATAEEQAAAEEQARLGAEKEAAEEQARLAAEKEAAEEQARLAAEKEAAEEQARLAAEKAEAAIMEQCRSYTQLPQSEPTTHGFAIVDYKDTIYRTPPMLSYDVPGDGRCFYHAVAACLRGSADTWSEIEKDETNLCSLLHEKLNKFRNIQENDSTVAVDSTFLQWLIIEFLETVPPDHPLFTNTSVEGTPILVVDESKSSEDALTPAQLIARIKNSCVEGWGGRQEAFVLHYALKGLVTVIMMHANVGSDGLSLLMNASNCSHQDDDRAFIFLEHTNSSHWRALSLLQGIVQNFIVPLTTLRRQQELVNKCTHKGSIAGNMIKSQVPYSNGTQLVVIGPEESNFYGALAVALHITKLENGDEWDDAMCRALRQQYDRFQVTHTSLDPSLADTMFIEYLCRDATNKESIFSVMDAMEDALDNLCRINLHRRGGIVKRSKPRKLDHAAKTYELNVYQEGDAKITKDKISPRHNMYIAINQGQPIQSDKDQAYVTREGYTAPSAIAVLSGVFRAAQSLPQELDAMGYLGFDDESYKPNRTKKTENYRIDAGTCAPSNIVNLAHLPGGDSMGEADTRNLSSCGLEAIQLWYSLCWLWGDLQHVKTARSDIETVNLYPEQVESIELIRTFFPDQLSKVSHGQRLEYDQRSKHDVYWRSKAQVMDKLGEYIKMRSYIMGENHMVISNMAWEPIHDEHALFLMERFGLRKVEMLPTKYATWDSFFHDPKGVTNRFESRGITVYSLQSLLYGIPGDFLAAGEVLQDHLKKVLRAAKRVGCSVVVLGSPKTRVAGLTESELARQLQSVQSSVAGVKLCLEANAAEYGCHVGTDLASVQRTINGTDVCANMDTGNLLMTGHQAPTAQTDILKNIAHVQISTPYLQPLTATTYVDLDNVGVTSTIKQLLEPGTIRVSLEVKCGASMMGEQVLGVDSTNALVDSPVKPSDALRIESVIMRTDEFNADVEPFLSEKLHELDQPGAADKVMFTAGDIVSSKLMYFDEPCIIDVKYRGHSNPSKKIPAKDYFVRYNLCSGQVAQFPPYGALERQQKGFGVRKIKSAVVVGCNNLDVTAQARACAGPRRNFYADCEDQAVVKNFIDVDQETLVTYTGSAKEGSEILLRPFKTVE